MSETTGFGLDVEARISVESTLLPTVADRARPLVAMSVTMARPAIVRGRPVQPLARSTTRVLTGTREPEIPQGEIPTEDVVEDYPEATTGTFGQPRHRWLSIDALRDPDTHDLTRWPAHGEEATGPAWTTPGTYRPAVGNLSLRMADGSHVQMSYPAVNFDSFGGDHLNTILPADIAYEWTDTCTWVLVGSFRRLLGEAEDSCPILDFASRITEIDYETEAPVDRGDFRFADPADAAEEEFYTGLGNAAGGSGVVVDSALTGLTYTDDTLVVLAMTASGATSQLMITTVPTAPTTSYARVSATTPRFDFNPAEGERLATQWSLARSRFAPPLGGLLQTGTMSLLEVAFWNAPLATAELTAVSDYLAGTYTPTNIPGGA